MIRPTEGKQPAVPFLSFPPPFLAVVAGSGGGPRGARPAIFCFFLGVFPRAGGGT